MSMFLSVFNMRRPLEERPVVVFDIDKGNKVMIDLGELRQRKCVMSVWVDSLTKVKLLRYSSRLAW